MAWAKRGDREAKAAADIGASIYAWQEMNTSQMARTIRAAFGESWLHIPTASNNDCFYDGDVCREYQQTTEHLLTSYQVRRANAFYFENRETERRFTHVNTHFPAHSYPEREKAAIELRKVLADLPGPVILTGDFNNDTFYAAGPHGVLRSIGYKTMREQAVITRANRDEFYPGFKPGGDGTRWLSDIFTIPADAAITGGELVEPGPGLSDHGPLRVDITIPA